MYSSCSARALLTILCALGALLVTGCGASPGNRAPSETPSQAGNGADGAERDSALTLLMLLEQDAFADAFAALSGYAYTRHTRTEQRGADSLLTAIQEQTVRVGTRGDRRTRTVVAADSSGTFERGLLSHLAGADAGRADPLDVAPYVIPKDPAYLSARNREDFTYHLLPDTTIAGAEAAGVEVRARPSSKRSIRRLRLYVDRSSRTPIAVRLERTDRSLLYREQSWFDLEMQPAPSGGWLPRRTDVRTRLKWPLRPAQHFATTSTYHDVEEIN